MTDDQLLRYSRHILLDEIGVEGQARIAAARVVVVGAGGLGSTVLLHLAAAGVGEIVAIDPDTVDLTNLQRQIAHTTERIGMSKAESAAIAMRAINPEVGVDAIASRADAALLDRVLPASSLAVDCSDNFATRQALNAACRRHGKPLVSGSALRFDGQIAVFDPSDEASPCYACVFPPSQAPVEAACATMGVLGALVGVIGAMQAAEAIKYLVGLESAPAGTLHLLDARRMEWSRMRVPRDPACPVCGSTAVGQRERGSSG